MTVTEINMHLIECISGHNSLAQQVAKFMGHASCDTHHATRIVRHAAINLKCITTSDVIDAYTNSFNKITKFDVI